MRFVPRSKNYVVTVEWRRTSTWGNPKTHRMDMTLTKLELDAFVRETFASDPDVERIRFMSDGREAVRSRNLKMGDVF